MQQVQVVNIQKVKNISMKKLQRHREFDCRRTPKDIYPFYAKFCNYVTGNNKAPVNLYLSFN